MTEKEACEILHKIESEFPIHKLIYKGIEVWPLLRLLYSFRPDPHMSVTKNADNKAKKISPFSQMLRSQKVTTKDRVANLIVDEPVDLVFVARGYNRRELIDGKYFSKYANAIGAYLSQKSNYAILEYSVFDVFPFPRFGKSQLINESIYAILIKEKLKSLIPGKEKIKYFADLITYLKKHNIRFNFDQRKIVKNLELILAYKRYFKRKFETIRPKAVLFICYYTNVHMGLILACNELAIRTVEVQHGEQSIFNYKYNAWTNIPSSGYQLLPTDFWVWGMPNFKTISEWTKGVQRHQPRLGGNPWMNYYLKHKFRKSTPREDLQRLLDQRKNVVLVSLQYFEDFVESPLPQAIKDSEQDILWMIRLHPKKIAEKPKVDALLRQGGSNNYDLEFANDLNLYQLFEVVDIQVTFWSTVAYEALLFGIHTIIIHPYGYETLKDYISKHIFRYSLDPEEIIKLIMHPAFEKEQEPFIRTDDHIINEALTDILDHPLT